MKPVIYRNGAMTRLFIVILLSFLPITAYSAAADLKSLARSDRALLIILPEVEKETVPLKDNAEDCGDKRMLTRAGRDMAKHLGDALRDAGFGKAIVYSSQSCAAVETAKIMNLNYKGSMEFLNDISNSGGNRNKQKEQLSFFMGDHQGESTMIFITHRSNIVDLSGLYLIFGDAISITVNLSKFEPVFERQILVQ
jgi:phosphohistidine phosphatase SixA